MAFLRSARRVYATINMGFMVSVQYLVCMYRIGGKLATICTSDSSSRMSNSQIRFDVLFFLLLPVHRGLFVSESRCHALLAQLHYCHQPTLKTITNSLLHLSSPVKNRKSIAVVFLDTFSDNLKLPQNQYSLHFIRTNVRF